AAHGDLVARAELDRGGAELQLRIALGVEELGRGEVALQRLLVDVDAGDLDRALELRLLAALERRGVVEKAAAESGDAVVDDGEVDRRVDGVHLVGPGG